jgi:predicted metal-dependent phosphotriesterase family hydrolase
VTFVRAVLGDIEPADLGVTYAHEHLVIDRGRAVELEPDFLLTDLDRLTTELASARAAGLASAVDAWPAGAGRNPELLAELSRQSGVHVVAATGLHHERFYPAGHWIERLSVEELADLFAADVNEGIDANDGGGPGVRRTPWRAGVVKVAGSEGRPSARDARAFEAAALAQRRTGVPILTHCENGTGALEQLRLLSDAGADLGHVVLSHVDKVVDPGYHREIAAAGAFAEYDQAFRWGDAPNGTLDLLAAVVGDGFGDRIVLGMDAARQRYWRSYGGRPGLAFLLTDFSEAMDARGLDATIRHALFVDNPARVFSFRAVEG